MTPPSCPCGLRQVCPSGQQPGQALSCPVWQAHVKPSLWERFAGFFAAFAWWR
jgi:hypothetical protein